MASTMVESQHSLLFFLWQTPPVSLTATRHGVDISQRILGVALSGTSANRLDRRDRTYDLADILGC